MYSYRKSADLGKRLYISLALQVFDGYDADSGNDFPMPRLTEYE